MALNHHTEDACESIDASVFSGELLFDQQAVVELEHYMGRWTRAIASHRDAENCIGGTAQTISRQSLIKQYVLGLDGAPHFAVAKASQPGWPLALFGRVDAPSARDSEAFCDMVTDIPVMLEMLSLMIAESSPDSVLGEKARALVSKHSAASGISLASDIGDGPVTV